MNNKTLQNDEVLLSLFDIQKEGVITFSGDWVVRQFNKTALTLLDISDSVELQNALENVFDNHSIEEAKRKLASGGSRAEEIKGIKEQVNGNFKWLNLKLVAVSEDDSETTFYGLLKDTTTLRRAEKTVKASEEKIGAFLNSRLIGILMGDIYGNIFQANDEFLRITGYTREDLNADKLKWDKITPQEFLPLDYERIKEAQAKGACTPYEKQYIRKDGTRVWVFVGYILVGEKREDSVAFILDINELKAIQNEKEILIDELEFKNNELEQILYTVSHDLKSPVVTIKGFLNYLGESIAEKNYEKAESDLSRIVKAVDTMSQLINDILQISRIGRKRMIFSEVNVDEVIKSALHLLHSLIEEYGVSVSFNSSIPAVYADKIKLTEVFQNLIENSVKYRLRDKDLQIDIEHEEYDNNSVKIIFRDNGRGIESDNLEKIFNLFTSIKPESRSAGLGLAICKKIIEHHGGKIWAESDGPGKGSSFCFTVKKYQEGVEL